AELTAELAAEVERAPDDTAVLRTVRRFRNRHTLRIGINDVVRDRPLEEVTRELTRLADASIEVALQHALRTVGARFGNPTAPQSGSESESGRHNQPRATAFSATAAVLARI